MRPDSLRKNIFGGRETGLSSTNFLCRCRRSAAAGGAARAHGRIVARPPHTQNQKTEENTLTVTAQLNYFIVLVTLMSAMKFQVKKSTRDAMHPSHRAYIRVYTRLEVPRDP